MSLQNRWPPSRTSPPLSYYDQYYGQNQQRQSIFYSTPTAFISSGPQSVSLRYFTFRNGLRPLPLIADTHSFSARLPGSEAANLPPDIPEFWTGQKSGWSVLACVKESNEWTTYSLFGFSGNDASITPAQVVSGEYTSTRISL